jgi:hypothetical protein
MFIRIFVLQTILISIAAFKISERFLHCNRKAKVFDFKNKCIYSNGPNDSLCLNNSNKLKAIRHDEYVAFDSPNGKEIVYSYGKDMFETYCERVDEIEVITNPEKCLRDLKIQYMHNDQSKIGYLTKFGIIRNNSLQEKCSSNYQTFIKIKNFFIIKFKDKIIIKDEKDIINFEVDNKSILFNYFEKIFQVINQQHYSSNVLIIIVFILILCFSKKIKKYILKIRDFFVKKTNKTLDDSIIILESDHNPQKREISKRGRNKDKCVRYVDLNIDEVKKTKNTRSNTKNTKKNMNN